MSNIFDIIFDIIISIIYVCAIFELIILFFLIGWVKFLLIMIAIICGCILAKCFYKFVDVNINSKKNIRERKHSNSMKVLFSSIINNLSYLSLSFSIILLILEMFNKYCFIQHIINLVEAIAVVGSIYIIGISFVNNTHSKITRYHTQDKHIKFNIERGIVGRKYKNLGSENHSLIKNRAKECLYIFFDVIVSTSVIVFMILFWTNRYNEYKFM